MGGEYLRGKGRVERKVVCRAEKFFSERKWTARVNTRLLDEVLAAGVRPGTEFHLDLEHTWMVGDSWQDIEAARAARCRAIFIAGPQADSGKSAPDRVAESLPEAAKMILRELRLAAGAHSRAQQGRS